MSSALTFKTNNAARPRVSTRYSRGSAWGYPVGGGARVWLAALGPVRAGFPWGLASAGSSFLSASGGWHGPLAEAILDLPLHSNRQGY